VEEIMLKSFDVQTKSHTEMVDITGQVQDIINDSGLGSGLCVVFVPHTTAGVTINENADPSVRHDILMGCEKFVPEHDRGYRHSEGNSAGHIKSTLFGSSVHIIIYSGQLMLGTWQGVFFGEFDGPRRRRVHVKIMKD
jgi:secondary thiamine-phosphate synthase enzyme